MYVYLRVTCVAMESKFRTGHYGYCGGVEFSLYF